MSQTSPSRPVALIAIDQGTTSSRALGLSLDGSILTSSQQEFPQIYPDDGWVEHDPEAIWTTVLHCLEEVYHTLKQQDYAIAALGITNQRETTLVWDRQTGAPIYNAIVWQDRRTAAACQALRDKFGESALSERTGLLFDPYFSASKIAWILDHIPGARLRAERGELAFGTVDSFLISRLCGTHIHVTDATNASRTNLYNIHTGRWDPKLTDLFNIPPALLPQVLNSADHFGQTRADLLGESIPILGVAGDQQAAAIGQACFSPGDIKSTYGTGCFVLMNTGQTCLSSNNRLLSTLAYQLDGQRYYALEGSIFTAGAAVQWLRDGIGLIQSAAQTEAMAQKARANSSLYVVPAFTGLGAPHWDPDARGAILGLTRDSRSEDIVRATLDSICFQTHDLLNAMAEEGLRPNHLRIDGGMVQNSWFAQRLSDMLDLPVERPKIMETTALGAAYLAGLSAGLYKDLSDIATRWQSDKAFHPAMPRQERSRHLQGWQRALSRVLTSSSPQPTD